MNKKLIRLTETDLHRIVKESVKKIVESDTGDFNDYYGDKNPPTNTYITPYGEDKGPAFGENIPLSTSELMKKLNEIEAMLGTLTNRDRRFKEFLEEIERMRYKLRWMMNSESFG
jgi:hypothetical protein